MTESIFTAIGATAVFAIPCVVVAAIDYRKLEKQRKEREAKLLREQLTALACDRAVEAERLAWKNRVRQSLASWEPIKFADEVPTRKVRKWGRHAN
ncbi:hypothetical protein F6P74_06255 [Streptococcus suis]|uniref:hypothetical protein n=1 Tax=Streptococcus suis TaxID=1307 RepID=UPI001C9407D8|nr:hypothetical protein [Streptococcus suis]MBS8071130.1 hypothetical protein [Streptococcus suis]MBS8103603.1 hypothetical protein [Streptococcus suis]MBY4976986.1 hypothetical protein [Streptococcus suis]